MTALFYAYMESPIGRLLMLSDGENLTNLDCELEQTTPNPNWILRDDLPLFEKVRSALMRYFNGEPESFSNIPLSPKGTAFQQAIWTALRQIPYGKTASYGGLAESINNPKAVRAVGGAVGSNPISIIIPCHRVVGTNGSLTGYAGGIDKKIALLELEHIDINAGTGKKTCRRKSDEEQIKEVAVKYICRLHM